MVNKKEAKPLRNFQRNPLGSIILVLIIALMIPGCQNDTSRNTTNTSKDSSNSSSTQSVDPSSPTLYGAIQTPFANFRTSEDIAFEDYPTIYEKDGKMGFKDKKGKIIVEPIYAMVQEFWNGVGRVRINNPDGTFTWKTVNAYGKIFAYDDVSGFTYGLSPVIKDGKYGYINYDGELVVPCNYDALYNAYNDETKARSAYAVRDGEFVYLNLKDGFEEIFEKYDPNKASEYKRTLDLKDYNLVVVNDMLVVNGESDPNGMHFPLTVLQGLDFDLYTQDKKLGTYHAQLTPGNFEGEVFFSFAGYKRPLVTDGYEEYYAVLTCKNIENQPVTRLSATEKYTASIKQYLKDKQIDNTPFTIVAAYAGDFNGDGVTGAILEIKDTYRNVSGLSKPYKENWTEETFAAKKEAFVNAILIIDDIAKPTAYRIIRSNIWAHFEDEHVMTENIGFIANTDTDQKLELIISNGYYEYRDYSLIEL